MSNSDVRRPAQQPTDRDYARQSALHGFDSVMHGLRSILLGLKPYQDKLVITGANGGAKPTREQFLNALAAELLTVCGGSLRDAGFMPAAPQPADEPKTSNPSNSP